MRIDMIADTQIQGPPNWAVPREIQPVGEAMPSQDFEHALQQDKAMGQHSTQELVEAMDMAKERLEGIGLDIRLKMDTPGERLQVEVFDPETKEVLRRFPPDEIIRLAESIEENGGLLVNRSL